MSIQSTDRHSSLTPSKFGTRLSGSRTALATQILFMSLAHRCQGKECLKSTVAVVYWYSMSEVSPAAVSGSCQLELLILLKHGDGREVDCSPEQLLRRSDKIKFR